MGIVNDPFNLKRFVEAQDPIYDRVRSELTAGDKRSHWMWFIFPQIAGLGYSAIAARYAITSVEEAKAYLEHPVLGSRLIECTELVNRISGRSIHDIFGSPDDLKFRSCMTLFARAATDNEVFRQAIQKYFVGDYDHRTEELLARAKVE
jgi:uncharacterized protein (DUF1810 family)